MSVLAWFIAGAVVATLAIFFTLAVLKRKNEFPAEELDGYEEWVEDGDHLACGDRRA